MSDYQKEYEEYMKWLAELKAGDEVFISSRYDGAHPAVVSRVTKTQIIVQNKNFVGSNYEQKFRKDGSLVSSDSWNLTKLLRPTDDLRKTFENKKLISKVRSLLEHIALPNDTERLKELIAFLEKYQKATCTKKE